MEGIYLSRFIFSELKYEFSKYSHDFIDNLIFYLKSKFMDTKRMEKKRIMKAINYKTNDYLFDFALKTDNGYFIIKNFKDKQVDIDDILHLIHEAKNRFWDRYGRTYIYRILIVAKNYDKLFLERESLERIMTREIKSQLKVDLIVKANVGYSLLWISPYI